MIRIIAFFTWVFYLTSCSRQFAVTVNNQAVYDPRLPANVSQVADADLQGCVNLALRQQNIQNPAQLTVLSCADGNVRALDGIGQLTSLRFLDLANNGINDLEPLAALSQLSGLSIPGNPITDISVLLSMTGLTAVILQGNNDIPCVQLDRLAGRLGENLTPPDNCRD